MAWKIVKIVWGIFCLLFLVVVCNDFYEALIYQERYYFGSGGPAPIWYKTQELYLWHGAIMSFWFAAGFLFCLLQNKFRNIKWGIVMHLFFTLLYIFVSHMFFS
jgi:hypothetical protein